MNIFISNLDSRTTEHDLRELFSEYGYLRGSKIRSIMDVRTRAFNTFAYIEFPDSEMMHKAIDKYNNTVFRGRAIKIEQSQ